MALNPMQAMGSGGLSSSSRGQSPAELLDPDLILAKIKAKLNPTPAAGVCATRTDKTRAPRPVTITPSGTPRTRTHRSPARAAPPPYFPRLASPRLARVA